MPQISIDSLIGSGSPSYPENVAAPYREELLKAGFTQLLTPHDVEAALNRNDDKVILLIVNSVCGCSARVTRPGALLSLFDDVIPDELFTIFAGMEKEAVAHLREKYLPGVTPSSPNICVFKNGKLQHMLHRYQIERGAAGEIANELMEVYNNLCTKQNSQAKVDQLRQTFINQYNVDPLEEQV